MTLAFKVALNPNTTKSSFCTSFVIIGSVEEILIPDKRKKN